MAEHQCTNKAGNGQVDQPTTMSSIRSSALTAFTSVVTRLGGSPRDLMMAAGIQEDAWLKSGAFVPFETFALLLEMAAESLGCADFGQCLANGQSVFTLGPLIFMVLGGCTVCQAFQRLDRYFHLYVTGIRPTRCSGQQRDTTEIRLEFRMEAASRYAQAGEFLLATAYKVARLLAGRKVDFVSAVAPSLAMPGDAPANATHEPFVRLGRGGDHYSLIVDRRIMELTEPYRNKAIREALAEYVASFSVDGELCLADQVSRAILHLLPTGYCKLPAVSSCLGWHPRGLQRALTRHGLRFSSLLAEARREMALRYVADGIPLLIQASLLGYGESASLHRAFRAWRGLQ
ncbi:AraC family transcriptional regulator ligand-binding domain-containing protein [Cupriavidus oxalaticus]|uniref:AraC family transcriptional regulator ligand-binding domain-containing protein n=1 Tax=Cupriavidus oxalaticus TaxID=96344 RepID=UPI00317385B9